MIQIIGFLICAALAVKLLEMSGNAALHDEDGKLRSPVPAALLLGWASVIGFTLWLFMQGASIGQAQIDAQTATDCVMAARSVEEMNACPK
jgi:hypothetical protein